MNIKLIAAIAAATTGFGANSAWAGCGEVSITEMDWASSAVVTAVAGFLMENGYGCSVTTVPSSTLTAMASISETGEPDILTELWTNTSPVYEELRGEGKLVELSPVLSDGGVEGWWLPAYLVERHPELATLDGILKNPDLVGGRFHDCPSGWACEIVNTNNALAVNMAGADIARFQPGSGETLATSIAAAYADEKPWFGYYWAPTAVLGKYPMVLVDTGPFDAEAHACNTDATCSAPRLSPYPTSKVVTAVAPSLLEREPEVVEFLKRMSFTNDQMGAVLAWQEEKGASYEEAAVHFLTTYKDTWSGWLDDTARGNLSALLQ
ncbi:ABC transporter substrate-binding protein [Leisingera thetidis]|uniref:ABC transporter substrate-binding protein n=1 Tax=Leisingera thetidis TaxID=2930199 RepID=UPI0021F7CE4B|nr:ABC transporter substrate-binding protein [Leisingera thetidis]